MTLAARDLRLAYGKREAVRGVALSVAPGEIVALLGQNGSGKSTLLRGLARLLKPSGGVLELDGRALSRLSPSEVARNLALLAQVHEPVESLTVRDLVTLGRHPHQGWLSLPGASDAAAIEDALAQTEMVGFAQRRVSELSGGERQRAWLALALAQGPRILLLDEPTAYLDLAHQFAVMELVARLNRERGLTVVMALHDLGQAARYANRVILLRDGAVLADGSPENVLTPDTVRAAYGVEIEILRRADGSPVIVPLARADVSDT